MEEGNRPGDMAIIHDNAQEEYAVRRRRPVVTGVKRLSWAGLTMLPNVRYGTATGPSVVRGHSAAPRIRKKKTVVIDIYDLCTVQNTVHHV